MKGNWPARLLLCCLPGLLRVALYAVGLGGGAVMIPLVPLAAMLLYGWAGGPAAVLAWGAVLVAASTAGTWLSGRLYLALIHRDAAGAALSIGETYLCAGFSAVVVLIAVSARLRLVTTPFGPIKVSVDGVPYPYWARPCSYRRPPVRGHPLAGCYRIRVPAKTGTYIKCTVALTDRGLERSADSGEDYRCAVLAQGRVQLTIGAAERAEYEVVPIPNGLEVRLHRPVDEVVFGLAWADDWEEGDCRTWYAAAPSLDRFQDSP